MEANQGKRIKVVINLLFLVALYFAYSLFNVQVLQFSNFTARAQNQYSIERDLPAKRGVIYFSSRDGELFPAATNEEKFQILAVPRNINKKEEVSTILANHLGLESARIFEAIDNNRLYTPPLARLVDKNTAQAIADENLVGIMILPELIRTYPEQELGAQIIGFVNAEGKGNYGLEGYYDTDLRGLFGKIEGEKDNIGRIIKTSSKINPKDGLNLVLSIDRNAQFYVEQTLKNAVESFQAKSGSVIIMDVKTGEIITMANYPSFNPGSYNEVGSDQMHLFKNASIADIWEPGSIFKPLTMAMAIEEKLIEPDTIETFGSSVGVQGFTINTATRRAYGRQTMTQVLENSDNVGMVWIADKLGNDLMFRYLEKLKLDKKTAIDLDTEGVGRFPIRSDWRDITRATISFGQGVATTPLKMVQLYALIANGGHMVEPRIVKGILDQEGHIEELHTELGEKVFSSETVDKVTDMMIAVVENSHGRRASVPGYKVAGKTGTAQIPNPSGRGYLEGEHIGSFGGFFPANDPKYAMLVKLDQPKTVQYAESSAAPTFGEIAAWLLAYKGIAPHE